MDGILDREIRYLKGVGEKRAAQFAKLGVFCVQDLLYFLPKRYLDYADYTDIVRAPLGEVCAVRATVLQKYPKRRISGGRLLIKVLCGDDNGTLELVFFNSEYAADSLKPGEDYIFYGKVSGSMYAKQMTAPSFIPYNSPLKRIPVYPLTAGLSAKVILNTEKSAFDVVKREDISDFLPEEIKRKYSLCDLYDALHGIHFPQSDTEISASARRLAFDEMLLLQIGMFLLNGVKKEKSTVSVDTVNIDDFIATLPYAPTGAQQRVIREILLDFKSGYAMNRLLQGDVGSGKTLVAVCAAYCMCKNGYQSVIMAPTEILASQHYENITKMLSPFGVRVGLLTAAQKQSEKNEIYRRLSDGDIDILIGTNSVLSEKVVFSRLGLVITDEQHRFGVNQRNLIAQKSERVHVLAMSATPIPRTLAMIIYAGMQISVMDEMPPNRQKTATYFVDTTYRARMFGFINQRITAGEQCFIVLPAIDENEKMTDLQSVSKYCEEVIKPLLPGARVAVLHGRMKPKEKDAVMDAFAKGDIDILCSTTVVEVGIDVPNATVMVIENAERYGLSALHQLRGRVGRGKKAGYCILVSDKKDERVQKRLKYLAQNQDGFAVAQYDLENRGPGDFFGTRQHGLPAMKTAYLSQDMKLLSDAQTAAQTVLSKSPDLADYPLIKAKCDRLFSNITL